MRKIVAAVVGAALFTVPVAAQYSIAQDARSFGKRPGAWSVDISPSGNRAVLLVSGPASVTIAKVVDLNSGQATNILGSKDSREALDWCEFGSDEYLVCRYSGISYEGGSYIPFSRLISIKYDGSNMNSLGQKASSKDRGLRQFDGQVIDWLPNDPESVLLARHYVPEIGTTGTNIARAREGLGIDKVDLATGKAKVLHSARAEASSYMTDGRGNARIMVVHEEYDGRATGRTRYKYTTSDSNSWKPLGESVGNDGIHVLAVEADTDSAYVLKSLKGRDALYRMKLDGSMAMELVAKNDQVDIDGVIRVGKGQRIVGYTFTDTHSRAVYFDESVDKLTDALGKALPGDPGIYISGSSSDGSKMLIRSGADIDPGTYYVLDRTTNKMQELARVRPDLSGRKLATVKPVTYAAADGSKIPAYVTMPAGASGKNMPAVVLPHGGPAARDYWGFDWLPQFLAARGYVVIQPNYRGSTGYGSEFMNTNAIQNWRTAISDINDAGRYLVKEGIADPGRLAIVGWSYGGYAALQANVVDPKMYKASVAIAPVVDWKMVVEESRGWSNYPVVKAMIGDGPHVTQGSPLQHADKIKVPVLLFHGDYDINVEIDHSEKMEKALQKAGAQVEYVKYKDHDHQLDNSEVRGDMLNRIGKLLESTIG